MIEGNDMVGNYRVVTLCGSTRFKDAFIEAQKRLTLEGIIVISVGLFGHSGDNEVWKEDTKEMLDDMHLRKIDMADEIYVINVGGYIGSSTRYEIEYAKRTGKAVRFLETM
jgi:L-asparaginase/Glu-tRNA(Gln) amidotransferase subunit D